jgi:hypothetical protein
LLDKDEREVQCQMDVLHKYTRSLGMTISSENSQAFQVVAKKDTWFIKDPEVKIDNVKVSAIDPEEAFRYLGAKMGS